MRSYFFLFLFSVVSSYVLTRSLAYWATERGWANRQGDSGNTTGVPRLGGVGVFLSIVTSLALLLLWDNQVTGRILTDLRLFVGLLAAAALVFGIGLYDDLRRARPWQKLAVQIAAALLLFWAGFRVELLTNPITHTPMHLGWLAIPVTVLWLVAISNAFNLIDGLDGLAAGVGFFATLALFLLAILTANPFVAAIAAAMAGSLSGFLPHNFAPARIYLGDSGALTIGMILAALSVVSSQKGPVLITVAIPLLIFGLPLLDVGVTTFRRFLSGHPIFRRDEEHLHHRLLKMGLNQRAAVLTLYAMAALFVLTSLLLLNYRGVVAPVIALICGVMAWVMVRQMQYPEFAELDSSIRVALSSQRAVMKNNILLRRAATEIRSAESLDQLWDCACRAFAALDFETAVCRFDAGSPGAGTTMRWSSAQRLASAGAADLWNMSVPLTHEGAPLAKLELVRCMDRAPLLFRVSTLFEFLSSAVAPRMAELLKEDSGTAVPALIGAGAARSADTA